MRDNGYKNAAYALAELMDNSIEAGASEIKLVCVENSIGRKYLSEIAVIDNGKGMNKDKLELSLGFGNGTHLEAEKQKGIGKFGMGLPNSSISQCKKVEVYTWQNKGDVLYSYLDLDDIANSELELVPEPVNKNIPNEFKEYINSESGTLVLWSKIDRCMWQTARSIFKHSELLIGRIYRYFIQDGRVSIQMIAKNENGQLSSDTFKSNDPIYLMNNTSCPEPFDTVAMFKKWDGDDYEVKLKINYNGKDHEVSAKFTYAKEESRDVKKYGNAGKESHGKHAQQNLGVSIMREERELDIDTKWTIQYQATERWWGVEVNFPRELDDVFGVTNNKQSARNFTADLASLNESIYEDQTFAEYMDELNEANDPTATLIEFAQRIASIIKQMRTAIGLQTKDTRTRDNTNSTAEAIATNATDKLKSEGQMGKSDEGENLSDEDKISQISDGLDEAGIENSEAIAATIVDDGLKYIIKDGDIDGDAFFSVRPKGGKIMIILNINHPVYPKLIELLEEQKEKGSDTLDALKLIIMAWARYEDQQPDGDQKGRAQEARADWGRIAKRFLANKE
ncbi:MAG: ATP-binding protein [Endozoicomonadaceae bacterium]|nr:ATP-binding protein [Endozoicomonadaceae bacterium]